MGSASDPAGGAYSAPPDPYLYLGALLLRGGRGVEGRGEKRRGEEGREGEKRRGDGKGHSPPPVFGGSLRLWPLTTLSTIVVVTWNVRSELFNQKIEKK